MTKDKSLIIICGGLFLFCLFSAPQARSRFERRIDTFTVQMAQDTFYSAYENWRKKVNSRQVPCNLPECDTMNYYSTGMFRTGLLAKSEVVDTSHLKIFLTHIWLRNNSEPALYRIPNVTYTLKQELGAANNDGVIVPEKSYWAFLGLTLLNSGAGMAYAGYKSPFVYENVPLIIINVVMDAALTTGLFINTRGVREFSAIFLVAAKAAVGLEVTFIHEHNRYSRTGYKFIVGK
jgi:hypothetical protein